MLLAPAVETREPETCALCGSKLPAGTPIVCLPSNDRSEDPWSCVPCVENDPQYQIASTYKQFTAALLAAL